MLQLGVAGISHGDLESLRGVGDAHWGILEAQAKPGGPPGGADHTILSLVQWLTDWKRKGADGGEAQRVWEAPRA